MIVGVVTLLRKMFSFSNGCLQFVQNMKAVRILNLIVNFRLFLHSQYNLQNMNQGGLVHVLTLRLDSGVLLCWYNFQLASLITPIVVCLYYVVM